MGFPRPGIEPESAVLAGGFFSPEPTKDIKESVKELSHKDPSMYGILITEVMH